MVKKIRVRTPIFLQMEATECGAASLGSVCAYYKLFKPLEELRQLCGISRNGSKAGNILVAGEKLGFEAVAYRYQPEELKTIQGPAILHWQFRHFLVYEGYDEKHNVVYLNDPVSGHCQVSWEEFENSYTGITLVFRPGPNFKPGGKAPSTWLVLLNYLREDKKTTTFIIAVAFLTAIVGIVLPVIYQVFFDEVFSYKHREWLFDILLALIIVMIVKGALIVLRNWCLTRWQGNMVIGQSSSFLSHVLQLPVEFFQQRYVGEIASRFQFNESISTFVTSELAAIIIDVGVALLYLTLLFSYNPKLTIIGLLFTSINVGVVYYTFRWCSEQQQNIQQSVGKLYGLTAAGIATIETLKANGNEQDFFAKWTSYNTDLLNRTQKMEYYNLYISLVPTVLGGINSAAVMAVGGFEIMDGFMTLGIFIAFQSLMSNFQSPVAKIVGMMQKIQQTKSQMLKLNDVYAYAVDEYHFPMVPKDESGISKLTGSFEMQLVNFGYSSVDGPLIKKFNLKIDPGRRVAIVGGSGSGKSTIAKLAVGLYQPWSGKILFDQMDHGQIERTVLANSIALVEQDIFLFEGTVAENIALFDSSIDRKDIIRAAKDACIHRDISMLNGAYDGWVQEGGYNFSGGQRQRMEIARALAGNPSLIIFDEATSALDPVTERDIMTNIRRRGCACLIVAHRLSTIRDCDEIIVLDKGRVVQRGNHEKLSVVEGPYRRLIDDEG